MGKAERLFYCSDENHQLTVPRKDPPNGSLPPTQQPSLGQHSNKQKTGERPLTTTDDRQATTAAATHRYKRSFAMAQIKKQRNASSTPVMTLAVFLLVAVMIFFRFRANEAMDTDMVLSAFGSLDGASSMTITDSRSIRTAFNKFNNEEIKPLVKMFTMVGPLHLDLAMNAVEKLNRDGTEGAIVECGVWKGGLSMAMLLVNQRHNTDRHFYLYDTFEGLPEPKDDKNGKFAQRSFQMIQDRFQHNKTNEMIDMWEKRGDFEDGKWNYGPLDVVKNNMYYSGYPKEKIHFIQGKVEDSLQIPANLPDKIAVLRLDTDWYESTKVELEVLFERLVPGGLLAVDDFCHWAGASSAVSEYFEEKLNINATKLKTNYPCLHYWKPKK